VVKAAGGNVFQAENRNQEVIYNKEDILNPWFIVVNEKGLP
jgi:3'-phosphoadenosine 5'-phosphosulfate (PAPS) 3'-phosphatase